MDVTLLFKWEHDQEDASVADDGTVRWFMDMRASDDDAAAIKFAKEIAQNTGGTLASATIGDGDKFWAAARGAVSTTSVPEYMPCKDDAVLSAELANVVSEAGEYDLVMMGDAREFAGVAPAVAAYLGIPCVCGVSDVVVDPDDQSRLIARRTTSEYTETLKINTPVLIAVEAVDSEKTMPTMRQILAAKKLPITMMAASDLKPILSNCLSANAIRFPEQHHAEMFEGNAAQAVDDLVAALRASNAI